MTYVIKTAYDTASGEILRVIAGDSNTIIFPEETGVDYVDGSGDSNTQEVVNGQIVDKSSSVLEQQEIDQAWRDLTSQRNKKLYATDWTQVPDAPVDHAAWAVYRQELRDLPESITDPRELVWPEPPA